MELSGFWAASAVGLVVLWLFARDQFNYPSWSSDSRLTRILSVPDLRGNRVRRRALLVYALLLTVVYAALVFLVSSGVLGLESIAGSGEPDLQAAEGSGRGLPEPWVPLAVALAMVGLAPRSKILVRVEEKLREKAHELMGLPAGLFSAGQAIAEAEIGLDDIGREEILDGDLARLNRHCEAARQLLPKGRVDRLELTLRKVLAYKVWVVDGDWPAANIRKPYRELEAEIATDISARLADLDDVAASASESLSPEGRDALTKRWQERIAATQALCAEICSLMFIYSEKDDPADKAGAGRQRIARFFRRANCKPHGATELDILIHSLLAAVVVAGIGGAVSAWLRPRIGLSDVNEVMRGLITFVNAFFVYGPAMLLALWWHGQVAGETTRLSARRYLPTLLLAFLVSCVGLIALNITQAAMDPGSSFSPEKFWGAVIFALRVEWPIAVLGGLQGAFVAIYLDSQPGRPRQWWLVGVNVGALVGWAFVATNIVVPVYGRKEGPDPTLADYVERLPVAGLVGLIIGAILVWSLARGSGGQGGQPVPVRAD
jgi:hypothetical protein